jgi:hypothetical protein
MKTKPFKISDVNPGDEVICPEGWTAGPFYYIGVSRSGNVVVENKHGGTTYGTKDELQLPDNTPPKIVPYTMETVPLDAWFRYLGTGHIYQPTALLFNELWFLTEKYSYRNLLEKFERVERDSAGKWVKVGPAGIEEEQ